MKDLINAVREQIQPDSDEEFNETMSDVANHGADSGFHGFIYHIETVKFFNDNKKAILELANNLANDLGEDTFTMISNFNCLGCGKDYTVTEIVQAIYEPDDENEIQVKNALAWFTLEEVARHITDKLETA